MRVGPPSPGTVNREPHRPLSGGKFAAQRFDRDLSEALMAGTVKLIRSGEGVTEVALMVALLLGERGRGSQWWTGTAVAATAASRAGVRRSRAADQTARTRAAAASSAPTQFGAV